MAHAGLGDPPNLHRIPVDFTKESLVVALGRSSYDPDQLSFFSWLGVSFYLTRAQVLSTLHELASIAAPGSQVVFDYLDSDAFVPKKSGKLMQQMLYMAEQLGEPMKAGFIPPTLAADLAPLGLRLEENLDPAAIEASLFQGSNGYHPVEHFHYARLRVGK